MIRDVDGELVAAQVWHGSQDIEKSSLLLPASDIGGWWQFIEHDDFLNPVFNDDDPDGNLELQHQWRTSYANIVYEAFRHSKDKRLFELAERYDLENLGNEIAILFVTENEAYASSYGPPVEIDLEAEGLLAAIPDENINRGFGNWLVVFKAGSPFPEKSAQNYFPGM